MMESKGRSALDTLACGYDELREAAGSSNYLNRLARIRHRGGEATIDRDRLSVDIGRIVAGEKKSHRRQFMRLAGALQRIELADLVLGAALLGAIEHRLGHAGLDQAGTDRVDAHAGAGQRRRRLCWRRRDVRWRRPSARRPTRCR